MARSKEAGNFFDKIAVWSLYLAVFTLPFSKSILEITIASAIISVVLRKIITKERLFFYDAPVDIALAVFLITSLVSLINSSYLALSASAFFSKSLKFAALFLITREVINTREKLNTFIIIAASSCCVILADGFIQYFLTHVDILHNYPAFKYVKSAPFFLGAPTASFPFPNDYAAWILVFLFPAAMLAFFGKDNWLIRIPSASIFFTLIYTLYLTMVRGAWLSFLITAGLVIFTRLKKIIALLLIIIALAAFFTNKPLRDYAVSMASVSDRKVMWENAYEIFARHPITGSGLNTFYLNYAKVRNDEYRDKKGSYAHNCYLQTAAETGLIGLLSFLVFIGILMIRVARFAKNIKDPMLHSFLIGTNFGLIAFLLHSFVDTNLYSLPLASLFWLSAGLEFAIINIARSKA